MTQINSMIMINTRTKNFNEIEDYFISLKTNYHNLDKVIGI